jgi:hypothetical protein
VDLTILGGTYRFANTHLEAGDAVAALRALQGFELASGLADAEPSVILVGDRNANPGRTHRSSGLFDDVPLPEVDQRWQHEEQRGQEGDAVEVKQRVYPNKRRVSRRWEGILQFARCEKEVPH